ncbi:hypothetical protein FSPOR_3073 [Fusarium sporotrichioides]|uniref:Uncharacterized protein n=1 Tax=Fusarium sporotrichioides TaxID=5514 RepID=A0A395SHS3_FUSSP|nr:hypothetical protein FSPOR_3073 [Fusarium sporotrichioides]
MPGSSNNCGEFFSWFEVSYNDDKPHGSIDEINGQSADINKGNGGEYVWLIPHRAPRPNMMVNNIWTDIRGDNIDGRDDLAKGAGGDYRFFSWSNDMNANHFITDLALWRCGDSQSDPPAGWHGKTGDINDRRGGDYLYLVWRTKEYTGQK